MAEQITNLKVRFGADTTQFKKGMNDGKRAVQTFQKDAGNAIERFANQFGVSLGPLRGVLNSSTAATKGLSAGMKGAAASTNIFSTALKLFKIALISTGVGALIVALGTLISYFTNTQRGADKVKTVMTGFKAVINVLIDRLSMFGEGLFKIFTGDFKAGWDTLKESVKGVGDELKNEAIAAAGLEKARQKLRDQEISLIEVQSERNKEIAKARLLAEDETVAADKRLAAMQRAQALEQQTLNENKELQKERIRIMEEEVALGESTAEDYRMLAEEKAKINDIETASLRLQKRLQTEINSLTNEIESETAALIKLREAETAGFKPVESQTAKISVELDTKGLETDKLLANLKPALDQAKGVVLDFADTFNNAFAGLAVGFSESIGAMISGAEGFDDLGTVILSSLADLAIQVGKIAIGAGIAVLGIKQALMSLNPVVAIAAGAALIAIGSAIKGSLKSAASGGGSAGTFTGNAGVYDSRGTQTINNSTPQTAPQRVDVRVTGEFIQRGSVAVATIAETAKRSRYN